MDGNGETTIFYIKISFSWMMIPNLYIENGWKSPSPSIFKWLEMGFQEMERFRICVPKNESLAWSLSVANGEGREVIGQKMQLDMEQVPRF